VRLRDVAAAMDDHGVREPSVLLYEPDLVEALARSGRHGAAAEVLDRFADRATLAGPAAAAARCAGILRSDAEEFERALEAHDRLPQPFERGRTELAYGEYLRRARRIADARPRLATALDVFTRLGAEPWAERARAELQASGATSAPSEGAFADLTAQELQVALKVAEGATNREVGAALFLSHKTVEAHLSRAFRKLGVRSRAELARVFASQEALAAWGAGAEVPG
jgi:DNA-binding CsgD family transcriptional regulator